MGNKFVESFVEECYRHGLTELQAAAALEKSAAYEFGATSAEQEAAMREYLKLRNANLLQYAPPRSWYNPDDIPELASEAWSDFWGSIANAFVADTYKKRRYIDNPFSSPSYLINYVRSSQDKDAEDILSAAELMAEGNSLAGRNFDEAVYEINMDRIYSRLEHAYNRHKEVDADLRHKLAFYKQNPQQHADTIARLEHQIKLNDQKLEAAKKSAQFSMREYQGAVDTSTAGADSTTAPAQSNAPADPNAPVAAGKNTTAAPSSLGNVVEQAALIQASDADRTLAALSEEERIANGGLFDKMRSPSIWLLGALRGDAERRQAIQTVSEQSAALQRAATESREYTDKKNARLRSHGGYIRTSAGRVHDKYAKRNNGYDYSFLQLPPPPTAPVEAPATTPVPANTSVVAPTSPKKPAPTTTPVAAPTSPKKPAPTTKKVTNPEEEELNKKKTAPTPAA